MATVFLDAVFKPFFKIVHDTGQQLTIDRTKFPDGSLPSNHSTFGICKRKHAISNTPPPHLSKEKITRWKIWRARGPTARLRNGKWGARETCVEHWSLTRLQCALWLHCYWSGRPTGKECRPPRQSARPTYRVLPIQKLSGSRGSPCTTQLMFKII